MRWLTFLILLFFMSALQCSQLGAIPLSHANWPVIQYLPLLAVFYAIFAGEQAAPIAALVCGAAYDVLQSDYFGTTMIPLSLVALLILRVRLSIFREHLVSQMLLSLLALLAFAVLSALFRWLVNAPLEGQRFWSHAGHLAGSAIYTAIVSPGLFWLFFRFNRALGFNTGKRTRR
jgi:rod shape-determining protein MreD